MSDQHGTGALPSPPDPRDYPIALALETAPAAAIPSKFAISPIPPNLNQGSSPMCVAYAVAAQRMTQQYVEHHVWRDFDEPRLYAECKVRDGLPPGTPGTYLRTGLAVAKAIGVRTMGHVDEADNRIVGYYRVPIDIDAIRETLVRRGPIVLAMNFPGSWFATSKDGNPPAPAGADYGHAVMGTAYDDAHVNPRGTRGALLIRNSWSRRWGSLGNLWAPYHYVPHLVYEIWWAQDRRDA